MTRFYILALLVAMTFIATPASAQNGAASVEDNQYWHLHQLEDDRWWFPYDWIYKKDHDFGRVIPQRSGSKHHHPQQWDRVSAQDLNPRLRQKFLDTAIRYDILNAVKLEKIKVPQIVVGQNYRHLGYADQQYLLDIVNQQYGLKRLDTDTVRVTDPWGGKLAVFMPKTGTLQMFTAETDAHESWLGRQWRLLNE